MHLVHGIGEDATVLCSLGQKSWDDTLENYFAYLTYHTVPYLTLPYLNFVLYLTDAFRSQREPIR